MIVVMVVKIWPPVARCGAMALILSVRDQQTGGDRKLKPRCGSSGGMLFQDS